MARPRLGGWRQRLRRAEFEALHAEDSEVLPPANENPGHSHLGLDLLLDWGWGLLSGPQVQRFANKACLDGASTELLQRLGRLGKSGQHSQNIERELLNNFCKSKHPDRLVQMLAGPSVKCFLPPHEMFAEIAASFPGEFRLRLGVNPEILRAFWKTFRGCPKGEAVVQAHPHLQGKSLDDLEKVVPLVLHGDAGPYAKKSSTMILSWGSLVGAGAEKESTYLIASWPKAQNTDHCQESLWPNLKESFKHLASGRYPRRNLDGTLLRKASWRHQRRGELLAPAGPTPQRTHPHAFR